MHVAMTLALIANKIFNEPKNNNKNRHRKKCLQPKSHIGKKDRHIDRQTDS